MGADPENPFVIFDDVKELYAKRAQELETIVAARYEEEKAWAAANPEKAAQLKDWFQESSRKLTMLLVTHPQLFLVLLLNRFLI